MIPEGRGSNGNTSHVLGGLFAATGIAFVVAYLSEPRQRWWAIIPGCTLLGLSGLLILSSLPGGIGSAIGAPVFLASISLAFFIVFLSGAERWWALIPAGVMASVATVTLVELLHWPVDGGVVMMFGLAAAFGLVSLIETPSGKMRWALVPAGVLFGVGLLILSASVHMMRWLWPLAIIAVGLGFVAKSLTRSGQDVE